MTAPLREGLRPVAHVVGQEGVVPPSRTPARRWCPNTDRPSWLPPRQFHCAQDHALQQRYGMTCDHWWQLFEVQGGRCAVCGGRQGEGRRLVVDHDHDSGAVTGLCHFGCNRAISQRVRRYLADPPARRLGLLVIPQAKLRAIEAKDWAKRQRTRERAAERSKVTEVTEVTGSFGERTRAALRATGGK